MITHNSVEVMAFPDEVIIFAAANWPATAASPI